MEALLYPEGARGHACMRGGGWHSKSARRLHHNLVFLFRKAKMWGSAAGCWDGAYHLWADLARWSKVLDTQLLVEDDMQHGCKVRADSFCVGQVGHKASDASTATGDDVSGISSASPRRPTRHRPNRRTKRREKEKEIEQIGKEVAHFSAHEVELESGRLPLNMLDALRAGLEAISEEEDFRDRDCDDSHFDGSSDDGGLDVPESSPDGSTLASAAAVDQAFVPQASPVSPGDGARGIESCIRYRAGSKRKFDLLDEGQIRSWEETADMDAQGLGTAAAAATLPDPLPVICPVSDEVHHHGIRSALAAARQKLQWESEDSHQELASIAQFLFDCFANLDRAISFRPNGCIAIYQKVHEVLGIYFFLFCV